MGESIADGIARAVTEGAHLRISPITPLVPFQRIMKYDDQVALHVIYIDCAGEARESELKADSDVGEAIWIDKDALLNIWGELHEDT